ncbi:extensin-like [Panicum hallii]|jgi:hypothetical protein|uniref:extensin-like n=1 Tax=Panicum hallii TaxID=206008 RepID=UPI000DF4EB39|nr:extensin-like [Panicum hallii]
MATGASLQLTHDPVHQRAMARTAGPAPAPRLCASTPRHASTRRHQLARHARHSLRSHSRSSRACAAPWLRPALSSPGAAYSSTSRSSTRHTPAPPARAAPALAPFAQPPPAHTHQSRPALAPVRRRSSSRARPAPALQLPLARAAVPPPRRAAAAPATLAPAPVTHPSRPPTPPASAPSRPAPGCNRPPGALRRSLGLASAVRAPASLWRHLELEPPATPGAGAPRTPAAACLVEKRKGGRGSTPG